MSRELFLARDMFKCLDPEPINQKLAGIAPRSQQAGRSRRGSR
jgi:hypothetical protein